MMYSFIIICLLYQQVLSLPHKILYPELDSGYFEGDIILTPMQRNGVIDEKLRWPNNVVPYELDKTYTAKELNMLKAAIDLFHNNTCVKFVKKEPKDKDYVFMTRATDKCASNVGKTGGRQPLQLGPYCFFQVGTVAHELMHALGFYHEHSRTDRDRYVDIEWENIRTANKKNFEKYPATVVDPFGQKYDYESVLHYDAFAFSKNLLATIIPKDSRAQIGQRKKLSAIDIAKINAMYKCNLQ